MSKTKIPNIYIYICVRLLDIRIDHIGMNVLVGYNVPIIKAKRLIEATPITIIKLEFAYTRDS